MDVSSNIQAYNYPSERSVNHFGDCMVASKDVQIGVVVERFFSVMTDKTFKGDLETPLDERHVITIGKKDGKYIYAFVLSNAKFVNHSCAPNCAVNVNKEIVTIRPVKKGEELSISYDAGTGEWLPEWNFACLCQAEQCRKKIDHYIDNI